MIDQYFNRPLFWDYLFAIIIVAATFFLSSRCIFIIPSESYYLPISTDLSNISLTSAGFILTLLTVLITFKSGTDGTGAKSTSTFQLFFASSLYFETVKHLKNCIKSLIFISIIGFSLKLGLPENHRETLYFYNILGLVIIVLTLWRCLLILSKILEMQKENSTE
jgi:magnesium-transporting ATPase (P-type)